MPQFSVDQKILATCLATSFLLYHAARRIYSQIQKKEWIPVGFVKSLHMYPIKSCKSVDVFAFKCTKMGPELGKMGDRVLLIVDKDTGKFVTARQKPRLVHVRAEIKDDGLLEVEVPGKDMVVVDLKEVVKNGKLIRGVLHRNLHQDGYDCGDQIGQLLSDYIDEPNHRLIYWTDNLYTERTCVTDDSWWNNTVPKRRDDSGYNDKAPFHISTEGSMRALNERLDRKLTSQSFRPSILVEGCPAWDEDKWAELRIGEAELECFAPCTRCVLVTVDPVAGEMSKENEPLKKLREQVPEGKMRDTFKDSPVFGVYAGLQKEGYIHVGQTVYARYKPSAF